MGDELSDGCAALLDGVREGVSVGVAVTLGVGGTSLTDGVEVPEALGGGSVLAEAVVDGETVAEFDGEGISLTEALTDAEGVDEALRDGWLDGVGVTVGADDIDGVGVTDGVAD